MSNEKDEEKKMSGDGLYDGSIPKDFLYEAERKQRLNEVKYNLNYFSCSTLREFFYGRPYSLRKSSADGIDLLESLAEFFSTFLYKRFFVEGRCFVI